MKAFALSLDQVSAVVDALAVDGRGGARSDIAAEDRDVGLRRGEAFFGVPAPSDLKNVSSLHAAIGSALQEFCFAAAGGAGPGYAHPAAEIYADAAAAANLLSGRRRILSVVSPHSLIGFVLTVLAPNLQGVPTVDARALDPESLGRSLQFGDALVATPTLWRYLVREGLRAPDNAMAVLFGEPSAPELSAAMRQAGFGAQREVYGSTQTGVIAWRDSPADPFVLFDHWRRRGDALERCCADGSRSPVEPMDRFAWERERAFRLGGRRDGAVQIGAVNVFPDAIAALIAAHPGVATCDITVSRHPDGANRLIASIRLKDGAVSETAARSIDNWCRARLKAHERPRVYNFL